MLSDTTVYYDLAEGIEGWFTPTAVEVSNLFLSAQSNAKINGDLLEIGAWHGRSALLWMLHAREKETVYIVDLELRDPLRENLEKLCQHPAINCKVETIKGSSYRVPNADFCVQHSGQMRLLHVDGDHTAAGIQNDLAIVHKLLHTHGVIIVDDFLNPRFPQITEVTMKYLTDNMHELALIAVGGNKGYVVKAKFFDFWTGVLDSHLLESIRCSSNDAEVHIGTFNCRPCYGFR